MIKKIWAIAGLLGLSLNASAAYFSLADVVDQSSSFSVTADGVTMTVDSPSPGGLLNFADGFAGLDFGDGSEFVGAKYILHSFSVSFDQTVTLTSIENSMGLGAVDFSITGDGVAASYSLDHGVMLSAPLLFKAGERYTFTNAASNGNIAVIDGFEASVVPVPAAAWLFGSSVVGLAGLSRKKRTAAAKKLAG